MDRVLPPYPPDRSTSARRQLERLGVTFERGRGSSASTIAPFSWWSARPRSGSLRGPCSGRPACRSRASRRRSPRPRVPSTDRAGRIVVGPDLSLATHPEIFVVGDAAVMPWREDRPVPGVAQGGIQGGSYAAKTILRRLSGAADAAVPLPEQGRGGDHRQAGRGHRYPLARAVRPAGRVYRLAPLARNPHRLPDRLCESIRRHHPLGAGRSSPTAGDRASSPATRCSLPSRNPNRPPERPPNGGPCRRCRLRALPHAPPVRSLTSSPAPWPEPPFGGRASGILVACQTTAATPGGSTSTTPRTSGSRTCSPTQRPLSDPPHHDEMLFIVQHQTTELWFKLMLHELRAAIEFVRNDDLESSFKILARVKHIQTPAAEPVERARDPHPDRVRPVPIRPRAGERIPVASEPADRDGARQARRPRRSTSSGTRPRSARSSRRRSSSRASTTSSCAGSPAAAWRCPREVLERDVSPPYAADPGVTEVIVGIYEHPDASWDAYEMAEKLVDVDETYSLWRYRHLKVVLRVIGHEARDWRDRGGRVPPRNGRRGVLPGAVGGADGAARAATGRPTPGGREVGSRGALSAVLRPMSARPPPALCHATADVSHRSDAALGRMPPWRQFDLADSSVARGRGRGWRRTGERSRGRGGLDHRADAFAAPHPIEGPLQAVEADPPGDQPLDRQATLEVEPRVPRKVDRRHRGAVVRADDPASAIDEREDLERRPGPEWRHPDEHGRPAVRQAADRQLDRRRAGRSPPRTRPDRRLSPLGVPPGWTTRRRWRGSCRWRRCRAPARASRRRDRRQRSARPPRAPRPSRPTGPPRRAR